MQLNALKQGQLARARHNASCLAHAALLRLLESPSASLEDAFLGQVLQDVFVIS